MLSEIKMAKLRQWIALCSFSVFGCFVFIFFFYSKTNRNIAAMSIKDGARAVVGLADAKLSNTVSRIHTVNTPEIKELIEARNNISRLLNLKQQELGRLQCEVRDFACLSIHVGFMFFCLFVVVFFFGGGGGWGGVGWILETCLGTRKGVIMYSKWGWCGRGWPHSS